MKTRPQQITYLDSTRLQRCIVSGIRNVINSQSYLNKINVFPVADGDTGTNMALTLSAILEGVYNRHFMDIPQLLDTVADCALNGARGNSGTILAQFFVGFSEGAQNVSQRFTTRNFVAAVSTASNFAHKSLSEPKEGTILSVIREFSDAITHKQLEDEHCDFLSLLKTGLKKANIALENTQNQLKELKKAGVVDAGALGFINFLTGIYEFTETGSIDNLLEEQLDDIEIDAPPEMHIDIDEEHRFCTECIINGDINTFTLRHELEAMGNCVIVAGSSKKAKIHVHTNNPQAIFEMCRQHGALSKEKADDMLLQQQTTQSKENPIVILTDSGIDFPEGTTAKLNIHVVPLTLSLGDKNFIDKVTISPQEFYQMLRETDQRPKTSQPSLGEFKRLYSYLLTHFEEVIAIHIPAGISGTFNASRTAAQSINADKITLIDSLNVAAASGMIVMRAAEAAANGASKEDIIKITKKAIANTHIFATLNNLDYVVSGGRLPKRLAFILNLFRLKPVLSIDAKGKISKAGILRVKNNLPQKLAEFTVKKCKPNLRYHAIVSHTDNPKQANELKNHLMKNPQFQKIDMVDCAPVLGAHAGPDSIAVAIQTIDS